MRRKVRTSWAGNTRSDITFGRVLSQYIRINLQGGKELFPTLLYQKLIEKKRGVSFASCVPSAVVV